MMIIYKFVWSIFFLMYHHVTYVPTPWTRALGVMEFAILLDLSLAIITIHFYA